MKRKKNSEHATNFSPENIANAAKKRFLRFWTWDSKNGAKVTLGTTLDDLYKEDSSILALFLRYWQIHEILQNLCITYRWIHLCLYNNAVMNTIIGLITYFHRDLM